MDDPRITKIWDETGEEIQHPGYYTQVEKNLLRIAYQRGWKLRRQKPYWGVKYIYLKMSRGAFSIDIVTSS